MTSWNPPDPTEAVTGAQNDPEESEVRLIKGHPYPPIYKKIAVEVEVSPGKLCQSYETLHMCQFIGYGENGAVDSCNLFRKSLHARGGVLLKCQPCLDLTTNITRLTKEELDELPF